MRVSIDCYGNVRKTDQPCQLIIYCFKKNAKDNLMAVDNKSTHTLWQLTDKRWNKIFDKEMKQRIEEKYHVRGITYHSVCTSQ